MQDKARHEEASRDQASDEAGTHRQSHRLGAVFCADSPAGTLNSHIDCLGRDAITRRNLLAGPPLGEESEDLLFALRQTNRWTIPIRPAGRIHKVLDKRTLYLYVARIDLPQHLMEVWNVEVTAIDALRAGRKDGVDGMCRRPLKEDQHSHVRKSRYEPIACLSERGIDQSWI